MKPHKASTMAVDFCFPEFWWNKSNFGPNSLPCIWLVWYLVWVNTCQVGYLIAAHSFKKCILKLGILNSAQCWSVTCWTLASLPCDQMTQGSWLCTQGHSKTDILCLQPPAHCGGWYVCDSRWDFCPKFEWCHPGSLLQWASRRGCRCSMLGWPSYPGRNVVWTQTCASSLNSGPMCAQCCGQTESVI